MLKNFLVKEEGDFILSMERDSSAIQKRLIGNYGAKKIMPVAYEYSKKVASFPFVEAVLLSGSLSKNYYDESGDIDFFIVTKPNRLWICRTLLIIRYKLLAKDKKRFWCTNYFISSDNLSIPDVNIFTGTEIAYLIPTVNYPLYKKILQQNSWYKDRFPNKKTEGPEKCLDEQKPLLKSFTEKVLKGRIGNWLDTFLLEYTLKRWRRKYASMPDQDFDLQFRSRKDVCKRHTHGFQNKILVLWENKSREFESKFNSSLNY